MERDTPEGERYAIVLRGVAGLCASNCGFWGPSPHVLDLEAVTEEEGLLVCCRNIRIRRWGGELYVCRTVCRSRKTKELWKCEKRRKKKTREIVQYFKER